MGAETIPIAIEADVAHRAEAAGLDVAGEAERPLRALLSDGTDVHVDKEALGRALIAYDRYTERNGLFADGWRSF